MKEIKLNELENGKVFKVGDVEFIKFSEENGEIAAVAKECVFCSQFGKNNDFKESEILKRLTTEFLPKIAEAIGEENIVAHRVDLTSLDGLKTYGETVCKVSIPTFDFYRANVSIFDEYKPDSWWWLATPDTTSEHLNDYWCRCVSSSGFVDYYNFYVNFGVRPFLKFVSSIFVSYEE